MGAIGSNVIVKAEADTATLSVRLTWANGATTLARFADVAGKGVFTPLADPAFFAQVAIGPRGRTLEWPDDIECCADGLWFEAHPQDNPFASHSHAAE